MKGQQIHGKWNMFVRITLIINEPCEDHISRHESLRCYEEMEMALEKKKSGSTAGTDQVNAKEIQAGGNTNLKILRGNIERISQSGKI